MSSTGVAGGGCSTPPPSNETGLFQCGSCKRHYNRLDHLARHIRSHTGSKPHRCSICGKSFSRTDLLRRHVAAHEVRNAKVNNRSRIAAVAAAEVPGRVTRACRPCAVNHVRCTESKPCRRCAQKGLKCVFARADEHDEDDGDGDADSDENDGDDEGPRSDIRPASQETRHLLATPISVAASLQVQPEESMPLLDMSETAARPAVSPSIPLQSSAIADDHQETGNFGASTEAVVPLAAQGILDNELNGFAQPGLPAEFCTPSLADWDFLPGLWSGAGGDALDINQSFPEIGLGDVDLRFLGIAHSTAIAPEDGDARPEHPSSRQPLPAPSPDPAGNPASAASEAFRNHHWRFWPSPRDHGAAEEQNLSLPSGPRDNPSPESHIRLSRTIYPACHLDTSVRDNILTTVIQSCRPENLPKAVAAFPSAELLDALIQHFLASPLPRACSFIHTPTLDPNRKRPELLLAMAAAGAVVTADPTLAKLGYAMQECVRVAVPRLWESDNTLCRNLELTQAYLINLEIGLWSGRGRKVEIAESSLQAILTMIRRDGRFRKSSYAPAKATVLDGPDTEDAGDASDHRSGDTSSSPPEIAWRAWVEQESFKRTAFRIAQHDHDSSMYLLTGPLVSYAELTLPLPCAPALWAAPTAQQWRQQSLQLHHESSSQPSPVVSSSRPPPSPPSIADYLGDLATFQSPRANMAADIAFAKDAFLSCAWSLAWECMQLSALHRSLATADCGGGARGSSCLSSPFIMTSRRDELLRLLAQFRLVLDTNNGSALPSCPSAGSQEGRQDNNDVAAQVHSTMLSMRLELIQMHLHTPFEEAQVFAGMEGPEHARAAYSALAGWAGGADGA
ncbi:hypothetical protein MAPG_11856, partial [Magnaporthiopsis poae ATCC 64411]